MTLRSDRPVYPTSIELLAYQNISLDLFNEKIARPYWKSMDKDQRKLEDLLPAVQKYFGLSVLSTNAKQKSFLSLSKKELEELKSSMENSKSWIFGFTAVKILNSKAGISWATTRHSGSPVPVFAIGAGAKSFNSYFDNTELAGKLSEIMGLSLH
jgi:alkaline phosphatase